MKIHALIIALSFVGIAAAQSESKTEKKFQRYENGELIEDKYYLEENGRAIAGEDFEMPEMSQMEADMDAKMAEMEQRMNAMQQKSEQMMSTRMADMQRRMDEMKQRSMKMQQEMQQKMNEQKSTSPTPSQAPNTPEKPSSLGTTYRS